MPFLPWEVYGLRRIFIRRVQSLRLFRGEGGLFTNNVFFQLDTKRHRSVDCGGRVP